MVDAINNVFKSGQKIELQNRGAKSSGITFELKSVFDDLAKQGLIKDKDGKGLTKQDALNLYNMLNQIHQNTGRATNYTTMQTGQSFDYTAEEMKALAEAAGYELVESEEKPTPKYPEILDASQDKPVLLGDAVPDIDNSEIKMSKDMQRAATESLVDTLGGKIINRSVDGQKQDIAVVEIDGQKVRREINDDGTLGDTLAATKTFGKNKYISGDFPPETRILEREVNGKKQQIGIYEDENGNKVRQLVEKDPKTGKSYLGENLVMVSSAGKNKYVTESKFNTQIREMLKLGVDEKLPEDLKAEYVSSGGETFMVFKKDGKIMSGTELKEHIKDYRAQQYFENDSLLKGWEEQLGKLSQTPDMDYSVMKMEGMDEQVSEMEAQRKSDIEELSSGIQNYKSVIRNWQNNKTVTIDGKQYTCVTMGDNKKYYMSGTSLYTVGLDGKPDQKTDGLLENMIG